MYSYRIMVCRYYTYKADSYLAKIYIALVCNNSERTIFNQIPKLQLIKNICLHISKCFKAKHRYRIINELLKFSSKTIIIEFDVCTVNFSITRGVTFFVLYE